MAAILSEFTVPKYFPDDLFRLVGEKDRPPYRWFLIGPVRSGTAPHIDPLATSAWNTLLSGRKRWVLFPPDTDKDVVKGKMFMKKGEDDEPIVRPHARAHLTACFPPNVCRTSIFRCGAAWRGGRWWHASQDSCGGTVVAVLPQDYFTNLLPRIKQSPLVHDVIEFVQEPGETVFVPGGWWHAVLNIENAIAITQNFASRVNFPRVGSVCGRVFVHRIFYPRPPPPPLSTYGSF